MRTKRIFIGTFISQDIFSNIYDVLKSDFAKATNGKWVEKENLHFTFKFLGDVDINIISQISSELVEELKLYNCELTFKGLSCFPNIRQPKVLFSKIFTNKELINSIYNRIEQKLLDFGFEAEKRRFDPHLTLQRIKQYDNKLFPDIISKYANEVFGTMSSFEVVMIESELTRSGPIYKVIK